MAAPLGDIVARGDRLWRLRKLNQQVDATIAGEGSSISLRMFYNSRLVYQRSWPSREDAIADAAERRLTLERHGWTAHW